MSRIIDTPKALLVEVPEDSIGFNIEILDGRTYLEFETILDENDSGTYDCIDLPTQYSYGQPILAAEMKEEDWEKVVESEIDPQLRHWFKNYFDPFIEAHLSAHNSGQSLLRYHNLQPETTVIIPKN